MKKLIVLCIAVFAAFVFIDVSFGQQVNRGDTGVRNPLRPKPGMTESGTVKKNNPELIPLEMYGGGGIEYAPQAPAPGTLAANSGDTGIKIPSQSKGDIAKSTPVPPINHGGVIPINPPPIAPGPQESDPRKSDKIGPFVPKAEPITPPAPMPEFIQRQGIEAQIPMKGENFTYSGKMANPPNKTVKPKAP